MDDHLESVASRALLEQAVPRALDLATQLRPYAGTGESALGAAVPLREARTRQAS